METEEILHLVLLIGGLAFLAGLFVYLSKKKNPDVTKLYLPCILVWGILYSLVFIPFTAPDETAHFASAYRLSNQLMGQQALDEDGNVLVREDDALYMGGELSGEAYDWVYTEFFTADHSEKMIGYGHPAMEVAFHAYLPQAIGITLARLLSFGEIMTVYLARFCNLLFFALCGCLAVKLAPFGKMCFFGVSMLPMTLELASSLSYDAFAIGLGMLFTSYVMALIYERPFVGIRQLLTLGVLLALLGPCKMVYIPLAALCFLIPREKFGNTRKFAAGALLVAALMLAGILFVNLDKMLVYFQGTEDPVSWAGGAAGYSISVVLKNPLQAVAVMANTLLVRGPGYIYTMAGGLLGWLQYEVDEALILFLLFWTLLTALPAKRKNEVRKKRKPEDAAEDRKAGLAAGSQCECDTMPVSHRIWSLVFCFCVVAATMFIMLLSWTPLSSDVVEGVQGRYFLPVLPLGLLALRNHRFTLERSVDGILIAGYGIADLLVLSGVFGIL